MTSLGYILVGLAAGTVSASLGVGGGVLIVPALVIIYSFDQHVAQGTSLAVIVPTAVVGAIVHARAARVVWSYAIPLGIAGVFGGMLGGSVALTLDETWLRRLFAAMLAITAIQVMTRSESDVLH